MRVFLFGLPYHIGGAMVEAGDTSLLWRRSGIEVTCIALTNCPCGKVQIWPRDTWQWNKRMQNAGINTVIARPEELDKIDGIQNSIVVAFCNTHCLHTWPKLSKTGCKLVWVPCMTYTQADETKAFMVRPPSAVVFQSRFQHDRLKQEYTDYGCSNHYLIHGAFETHIPAKSRPVVPFTVGRLARASFSKWPMWLWGVLENARERLGGNLNALCQGWDQDLERHCGSPPPWAKCCASGQYTTSDFLSMCSVLLNSNFSVYENWPRVGLEAMSAGVPLIVDDSGGWREMCGHAAVYCKQPEEFADAVVRLATDEDYFCALSDLGFYRLLEVADSAEIAQKWCDLLSDVQ